MAFQVYNTIIHFIKLTFQGDVLWNIVPLAIATVLILLYFQRYKEEAPGWNTYLSNSLVLLFVSIALFRYLYSINDAGAINFITYQAKSLAIVFLFLVGLLLMRFNFEHLLPEKLARYISSVLMINLIAYAVILFVYTPKNLSVDVVISLLLMIIVISIFLNLVKIPANKLFKYIEKEKEKEKSRNIKEEKYQIKELKTKLREMESKLNKNTLKKLEKQKKEAIRLKKVIKKK